MDATRDTPARPGHLRRRGALIMFVVYALILALVMQTLHAQRLSDQLQQAIAERDAMRAQVEASFQQAQAAEKMAQIELERVRAAIVRDAALTEPGASRKDQTGR